eukprot:Awhi_evm1s8172
MSEFSVWIDGDAPLSKFSMDEMLNKFESKQALDALYTFATTIYSEENVAFIRVSSQNSCVIVGWNSGK